MDMIMDSTHAYLLPQREILYFPKLFTVQTWLKDNSEQKESVTLFSRHVEMLKPYRDHLPHPISNPFLHCTASDEFSYEYGTPLATLISMIRVKLQPNLFIMSHSVFK